MKDKFIFRPNNKLQVMLVLVRIDLLLGVSPCHVMSPTYEGRQKQDVKVSKFWKNVYWWENIL
jgi:hypothetical protein